MVPVPVDPSIAALRKIGLEKIENRGQGDCGPLSIKDLCPDIFRNEDEVRSITVESMKKNSVFLSQFMEGEFGLDDDARRAEFNQHCQLMARSGECFDNMEWQALQLYLNEHHQSKKIVFIKTAVGCGGIHKVVQASFASNDQDPASQLLGNSRGGITADTIKQLPEGTLIVYFTPSMTPSGTGHFEATRRVECIESENFLAHVSAATDIDASGQCAIASKPISSSTDIASTSNELCAQVNNNKAVENVLKRVMSVTSSDVAAFARAAAPRSDSKSDYFSVLMSSSKNLKKTPADSNVADFNNVHGQGSSRKKPRTAELQALIDKIPRQPVRRTTYSIAQQEAIYAVFLATGSKRETEDIVQRLSGYDKFSRASLLRWQTHANASASNLVPTTTALSFLPSTSTVATFVHRPRGRPVQTKFEDALKLKLVFVSASKANSDAREQQIKSSSKSSANAVPFDRKDTFATVLGNCMHNYHTIYVAATELAKSPEWKNDCQVQTLKFSDHWIHSFISRFNFSRQVITKKHKSNRPTPENVQTTMEAIQAEFKLLDYTLSEIFNFDETPGVIGLNPKYMYAPIGGGGARAPDNDDRKRITINVCLSADGRVLPVSFIIKCATTEVDQSRTSVIQSLLADKSFNTDGKWRLSWWKRSMEVSGRCKNDVSRLVTFKRPYLKHDDGRVVWAQSKAYQDTPGMAMFADLVLGPAVRKSGSRKAALVLDSCSSHEVDSVVQVFAEHGIKIFYLPVNMTDILQPVDLVANAPIKALVKRARAVQLYDYFQQFVMDYTHSPSTEYRPPAPTQAAYIELVSRIFSESFTSASFADCVKRCFVSVGLAPLFESAIAGYKFVEYKSHDAAFARVKNFRGHINNADATELSALDLTVDVFVDDDDIDGDDDEVDFQLEPDIDSAADCHGDDAADYVDSHGDDVEFSD